MHAQRAVRDQLRTQDGLPRLPHVRGHRAGRAQAATVLMQACNRMPPCPVLWQTKHLYHVHTMHAHACTLQALIVQVKPKMVLTLLAAAFQQDMLRRKLGKEECVGLVQKWTEEAAAENANAAAATLAAAQAAAQAAALAAAQAQRRKSEDSGAKSDTSDESVDTRSPSHSVGDEPDEEALARTGWLAWALAGIRTAFGLSSPKGGGGTVSPKRFEGGETSQKRQRTDGADGANGVDGSSRLTNQGTEEYAPFYLDIGADETQQSPPALEGGAASTVGDLPMKDLPIFDQNDATGNGWDVQNSVADDGGADGAAPRPRCPSRARSCSGGSDGPQLSRGARRTSMRTSIHLTYGEL